MSVKFELSTYSTDQYRQYTYIRVYDEGTNFETILSPPSDGTVKVIKKWLTIVI
jgi:hypothetical protein